MPDVVQSCVEDEAVELLHLHLFNLPEVSVSEHKQLEFPLHYRTLWEKRIETEDIFYI